MWRPFLFLLTPVALAGADASDLFETKVRPLLATNCYACHTESQMGGLRLDSRESMLKGGKSGAAIQPGKPDDSLLIQAVRRTHARLKMPPTAELKPEEVAALAEWVKRGAEWPATTAAPTKAFVVKPEQRAFWSFQPIRKTPPPPIKSPAWVKTPVDQFILAKLEEKGIQPVSAAGRHTWLRRITLDVTGLPPTPEETQAYMKDTSPEANKRVVDRLLASPHYGERWGRHWLDLARYSDGQLAAGVDTPLPNAYRYRDWVVDAFNRDLPYDKFVRAQVAADHLDDKSLMPGLGFQALALDPNDMVDVTTKVFLGFTVGCAQCHDHKYDPIPTRDYYSLLGIFRSSKMDKFPLVAKAEVDAFEAQEKKIVAMKEIIADYIVEQQKQLVDTLARNTAGYLVAAWKRKTGLPSDDVKLDKETLDRWVKYLSNPEREHPYLKPWFELMARNPTEPEVRRVAEEYQKFVLELIDDGKEIDDKNYVAFGGRKGMKNENTRQYTNIVSLPVLKFYQLRELAMGPYNVDGFKLPAGVYYYSAKEIERFLTGFHRDHLDTLKAELKALETASPKQYPFLHTLRDNDKPADIHVAIRGDSKQPGEVAPRRFLEALCDDPQQRFTKGSGRMELADAIVQSPLAARVIVNRIWQHHFGRGIVGTPSNFGQMGERPSHPELLDYLAARLKETGWSMKAIHREILLSNTYALSTARNEKNETADASNHLLWRQNMQHRLDMESMRDSLLAVSGELDRKTGGAAGDLSDNNKRRSLYLTVSRTRLDPTMALFDFPDPNGTTDNRPVTAGPLQGLFFLNSKFLAQQSRALESRLNRECGKDAPTRIRRAYELLYARQPDDEELRLGIEYTASGENSWPQYLQVLLGSGEFTSVN